MSHKRAKQARAENPQPPENIELLAERERAKRVQQCATEINALLEKYRCEFSPITVITRGEIRTQVQIVSK